MKIHNAPLLIVDVQNGFVNDNSRHVLPAVRELALRWVDAGLPIYMSQFTNHAGSQWERLIGWKRLASEHEIAIHDDLADVAARAKTFRKRTYTCLVGPLLDDLDRERWSEVVLCGIATDGCVLATAIDLFEYSGHHVRPVVVRDACASHAGEAVHTAGIQLIERFIGRSQVVSIDDLFREDRSGAEQVGAS
jgi:nicotinamidase-related amidase